MMGIKLDSTCGMLYYCPIVCTISPALRTLLFKHNLQYCKIMFRNLYTFFPIISDLSLKFYLQLNYHLRCAFQVSLELEVIFHYIKASQPQSYWIEEMTKQKLYLATSRRRKIIYTMEMWYNSEIKKQMSVRPHVLYRLN